MSNNEIVNIILKNGDLEEICKNITRDEQLTDDLWQDILLILLEYDNTKLYNAYKDKWLKYLVITIIKNQRN